ncbi:MAG: TetR/AcrR family transcriptional regulator [Phenylobacterium sp.]|nr:TetR/AcrR family transcriptional regulator [Phenylobacterium sp.]
MSSELIVPLPPQARGRARFEALLEAAAALIAERGVDGAAFSEVARRAGTAQGSLYQYFPSKAALVATLHARLADQLVAEISRCRDALRSESAAWTVSRMLDILLPRLAAFYADHPAYREIRHALPREPEILAAEARADQRSARLLQEMLTATGLRLQPARAPHIAEALIEAGDALLPWAARDAGRLAEVKAMMLAYLSAATEDAASPTSGRGGS